MAKAALALALLGFLTGAATLALKAQKFPGYLTTYWYNAVVDFCPHAWLVAAAFLVLRDRTTRYGVLVAALLVSAIRSIDLWVVLTTGATGFPIRRSQWFWQFYISVSRAPALLAATALVPAVASWWRRRHDRLADEDDAG